MAQNSVDGTLPDDLITFEVSLHSEIAADYLKLMTTVIATDDSSFLVVLIETHQSLWSELTEEGRSDDSRNLSVNTFFHQASSSLITLILPFQTA